MKLLVNNFQIKAFFKDNAFYKMNGEKIDESTIQKIILDFKEFKDIFIDSQTQMEKRTKKKIKDE